jgi:hypothetical protein
MLRLYSTPWVGIAVGLSILVVIIGWPAFQREFGFPASLFWTLAVVGVVWLTYLIRAWAWSSRGPVSRCPVSRCPVSRAEGADGKKGQ